MILIVETQNLASPFVTPFECGSETQNVASLHNNGVTAISLLLGLVLEEIDHALEKEEFTFLEFFLFLELLIDRCQLLHGDFQVHLVEAFGILAQFVEFGKIEIAVAWLLHLFDIEKQFLHPVFGIAMAGGGRTGG